MAFTPTPKQAEALKMLSEKRQDGEPRYKYFLLAGGSRSGKTAICCYNLAIRAYSKPSRHAILRFHFNDVKTSIGLDTLPKILKLMGIDYELNKTDWYFTIECEHGGTSEIWLSGTDQGDNRIDRVLGKEYSTIYFNECSQISYQAYTTVLTRLAENSGLHNRVYIDCNPVGKSHYLYKMFILGLNPTSQEELPNKEYYGSIVMNPHDNPHLPPDYISGVLATLPERQKQRFLYGEWQDQRQGALFNYDLIERVRVTAPPAYMPRAVVGVDPAISSGEESDETGIVSVAVDATGEYYVLSDYSGKFTPSEWAERVNTAYTSQELDGAVIEVNQGGQMCEHTLKTVNPNMPIWSVHSCRGKAIRAEPIVALYEQGKVHHVGMLPELEEQMTEWTPEDNDSPDRIDALVHALTYLIETSKGSTGIQPNSPIARNRTGCYTPIMRSGYSNGRAHPPRFGSGGYQPTARQHFRF